MVCDVESNGKAKNFKAPMTDLNNWPRISQLAWQIYSRDGTLLKERQSIIQPDGWTIPVEEFFIENNMSTERCEQEGVSLPWLFGEFLSDFNECSVIVCHNIAFDKNVIGAELLRYDMRPIKRNYTWICTMLSSVDFCQLPGNYGSFKWPTLIELHQKLFNKGFDSAHDALGDVKACADCLFELIKRGVITLPKELS